MELKIFSNTEVIKKKPPDFFTSKKNFRTFKSILFMTVILNDFCGTALSKKIGNWIHTLQVELSDIFSYTEKKICSSLFCKHNRFVNKYYRNKLKI